VFQAEQNIAFCHENVICCHIL